MLALEASRLARSSVDWHRLVEICGITKTLLADESAVYDPRDPNDRLLLGVKGTLSEAELMTIRCRLHDGRWSKARRGELAKPLPVGYVRTEAGAVVKHPDRQVQARLRYVFELFAELRVARRVVARLRREKLQIPAQAWGGPGHGEVRWKVPTFGAIMRLLHNPAYAGAYAYGQKEYDPFDRSPTTGKAKTTARPLADWPVCVRDAYPAYITWDQFVRNQQTLRDNWFRAGTRGAPRRGQALLQGIARCGRCGARMSVFYYSTKEKRAPGYGCVAGYVDGGPTCQMMSSAPVDAAVAELFLAAVTPAQVDVALRALDAYEAERAEARQAAADAGPAGRVRGRDRPPAVRGDRPGQPAGRGRTGGAVGAGAAGAGAADAGGRGTGPAGGQPAGGGRAAAGAGDGRRPREGVARGDDRDGGPEGAVAFPGPPGVPGRGDRGRARSGSRSSGTPGRGRRSRCRARRSGRGRRGRRRPRSSGSASFLPQHDYAEIAEMLNAEGFRTAKGLKFDMYSVGYVARSRGWGRSAAKRPEGDV